MANTAGAPPNSGAAASSAAGVKNAAEEHLTLRAPKEGDDPEFDNKWEAHALNNKSVQALDEEGNAKARDTFFSIHHAKKPRIAPY